MIKNIFSLFLILYSITSYAGLSDQVSISPYADYHTMESPHFLVTYPGNLTVEAQHSLAILERTHEVLAPVFKYEFHRKITVLITDNEDSANGVTSAIGHQGMVLYLTAPDPESSIGEYGHWLEGLIVHEYTHYLTLDRTNGIFSITRFLFGDLIFPNHFWPGWIAEGFAVYAESVFDEQGRGHGTFYNTLTRDSLYREWKKGSAGFFLSFDQLSGPTPTFPFGEVQYYAGYGIIDQLVRELGPSSPTRFAEESSWRIPYFLNGTLDNITYPNQTKEFRILWENWIHHERERMKPEFDWITKNGSPDPMLHSNSGDVSLGARLSPDGKWMVYSVRSGHEKSKLVLFDVKHKIENIVDKGSFGSGFSFSEDGTKLFYSKFENVGSFNVFSDLYYFDIVTQESHQLTIGERAKNPDFCKDLGLVYTTHRGRWSEVRILYLDETIKPGATRILFRGKEYENASNPRCSKDGNTVYFSLHDYTPFEKIVSVTSDSRYEKPDLKYITGGSKLGFSALFPDPLKDGSLYFTKAKDGYYDLAKWEMKTQKITTIAHSSGGYWLPHHHNNWITTSYVTSTGIYAAHLDTDSLKVIPDKYPSNNENLKASEKPLPITTTPILEGKTTSYSLFDSIAPRIWSPILTISRNQKQFGMSFLGWDIAEQLNYNFTGYYDSISSNLEGNLSTLHRIGPLRLSPQAGSGVTSFLFSSSGKKIYSEERTLGVSLSYPIPSTSSMWLPSIFTDWNRTTFDGDYGRDVLEPEIRLGVSLSFDNREKYPYSITYEKGLLFRIIGKRYFVKHHRANKISLLLNPSFKFNEPLHSNIEFKLFTGMSPKIDSEIPGSVVRVGGNGNADLLDPPLRGYPLGYFRTQKAIVLQTEYHLPLVQVFKGYDTWPIFIRNMGLYGFFDTSKMQLNNTFTIGTSIHSIKTENWISLVSSFGAGVLLNTTLGYQIPIQCRLEFAHGSNRGYSGENSVGFFISSL